VRFFRFRGQNDGASDLLVRVTGIDAQLDVQLDRLVNFALDVFINKSKASFASY
jgi:hypothetical protein